MSHNLENFEENKKIFKNKYQKEYPEVYDYCATWLEGDWSNWQIYCNKPGQANSNSNLESLNNVIKIDLSRKKLTMKAAITAIFEQIVYYSTSYEEFARMPKYCEKTKELADRLIKSNFKTIRPNKITYTGTFNGKKSKYVLTINDERYLNLCSCSCKFFTKHAVCMHLVAYSNFNNLDLFGNRYSKPISKKIFCQKS